MSELERTLRIWLEPNGTDHYSNQEDCSGSQDEDSKQRMQLVYFQYCALIFFFLLSTTCVYYHEMLMNVRKGQTSACKPGTDFPAAKTSCGTFQGRGSSSSSFYRAKSTLPLPSWENRRMPLRSDQRFKPTLAEGHRPMYKSNLTYQNKTRIIPSRAGVPADQVCSGPEDGSTCGIVSEFSGSGEGESLFRLKPEEAHGGQGQAGGKEPAWNSTGSSLQGSRASLVGRGTPAANQTGHVYEVYTKDRKYNGKKEAEELHHANQVGPVFCSLDGNASHSPIRVRLPYKETLGNINIHEKEAPETKPPIIREAATVSHATPTAVHHTSPKPSVEDATADLLVGNLHSIYNKYSATSESSQEQVNLTQMEEKDHEMIWNHLIGSKVTTEQNKNRARPGKNPERAQQQAHNIDKMSEIYLVKPIDRTQALVRREQAADCPFKSSHSSNLMVLRSKNSTDLRADYLTTSRATGSDGQQKGLIHCHENRDSPSCFSFTLNEKCASKYKTGYFAYPEQLGGGDQQTNIKGLTDVKVITQKKVKESTPHELLEVSVKQKYVVKRSPNTQGPCKLKEPRIFHTIGQQHVAESERQTKSPKFRKTPNVTENTLAKKRNDSPRFHLMTDKSQGFPQKSLTPKQRSISPPVASIMLARHTGYSKIITRKDMVKFSPDSVSRHASSVLPVNILSQVKEAIETLERSYAISESSVEKTPCPSSKNPSRKPFSPRDISYKPRKDDLAISSEEYRHTINDNLSPMISITGAKQRSGITKLATLTSELRGARDRAVGDRSPGNVNVTKEDSANPCSDSVAFLNIVLQLPVKAPVENKFQSGLDLLRPMSYTSQRATERQPPKLKGGDHSEPNMAENGNVLRQLSPISLEEPMKASTSPPKTNSRSSKKKSSPVKQQIKSSSVKSEIVSPEPSFRPQFHSSPRREKVSPKSPHNVNTKIDMLSREGDITTARRSPNQTRKPDCSTRITRASPMNMNSTLARQSNTVVGVRKRSEADILSSIRTPMDTETNIHVISSNTQKPTPPGAISESNHRLKSTIPIAVEFRNGQEFSKPLEVKANSKSEPTKLRVWSNPDNNEKDFTDFKNAWAEKAISPDRGSPSELKSKMKYQVSLSREPKVEIRRDHIAETAREVSESMSKKIITGGRSRLQTSFSSMGGLYRNNRTNRSLTSESSSLYQSKRKQTLNSGLPEREQTRHMVFGANWLPSSREKELQEKNSLKSLCPRANSFSPASTSRYRPTKHLVNAMGIRFLPYPRVFPQVGVSSSLYPASEMETKPEESDDILQSNSKQHANQEIPKPKEPMRHQTSPSVLLHEQLLNKFHSSSRSVTNTSISFSRAAGRRSYVSMVPGSDRHVKRVTSNADSGHRLAADHQRRPVSHQNSKMSRLRLIKSARSAVSEISAASPLAEARRPFLNKEPPHNHQTTYSRRMTSHSCELTQAGLEPVIGLEHTHDHIGASSFHTPQTGLLNDDNVKCPIMCGNFNETQKVTQSDLPSSRETLREANRTMQIGESMRRGSNVSVKDGNDKEECSPDSHQLEPIAFGNEFSIDLTQQAIPVKEESPSRRVPRATLIPENDLVRSGTPKKTPTRITKSSSEDDQQKPPNRPFAKFDASRLVIDRAYVKDIQDTSMISDTLNSSSALPTRKAPKYSYTIYTYKTKSVNDEELKEVKARSKHALNSEKKAPETLPCNGKKFPASQYHQPKISTSMLPFKTRHEVSLPRLDQQSHGHSASGTSHILLNRRRRGRLDITCRDGNTGSRTVEGPDDESRSDFPETHTEAKETDNREIVLTTSPEKTDMPRCSPLKTASKPDLSPVSSAKKASASSSLERTATPTYHFTEVECPEESSCRRTKLVRNVPTEILFASAPKVTRREDSGQHSSERSEISSRRTQAEALEDMKIARREATLDFEAAHRLENLRPEHKLLGDYQTGKRDSIKIHRTGLATEGLYSCKFSAVNDKKESLNSALIRRPTLSRQCSQRPLSEMERRYSSIRNTPAQRGNILNLRSLQTSSPGNNGALRINRNYSKPWRVGHVTGSSREATFKDFTSQNEGWLQPTGKNPDRPPDIEQETRKRVFSFSSIPFTINAKFTFQTCDPKNRNTPSTRERAPKALVRNIADDASVRCPLRYFPAEVSKMEAQSRWQKKIGTREEMASAKLFGFRASPSQLEAKRVSHFHGIEEPDTGSSLQSATFEKRHQRNVGIPLPNSKPRQKQDNGQMVRTTPATVFLNRTKQPLTESDEDTHLVNGCSRNKQSVYPRETTEDQGQPREEGYRRENDNWGSPRETFRSPCLQTKDSKSLSLSDRPDLLSEIDINCRTGVVSDERDFADMSKENSLNKPHRSRENAILDHLNKEKEYVIHPNHIHLLTTPDEKEREHQHIKINDEESARRRSRTPKSVSRGPITTSNSEAGHISRSHSKDLEGRRTHSSIVQDQSAIILKMDRLNQKISREAHQPASSHLNSAAKESTPVSAVSPTRLDIQRPRSDRVSCDSLKKERDNEAWSSSHLQQSQSSFSRTPPEQLLESGQERPQKTSRTSAYPFPSRHRHSKLMELARTFSESSVSNTVEKTNADFWPLSSSKSITFLLEKDLKTPKNANGGKLLKSSDINASKQNDDEADFSSPIVLSWRPSHLSSVDKKVKETPSMYTEEHEQLRSASGKEQTSVDAPKVDCHRISQQIDTRLLRNQSWGGRRCLPSGRGWAYQEKMEQSPSESVGRIFDKTVQTGYRARSQEKFSVFPGSAPPPAVTPDPKLVRGLSGSLKVKAPSENTVVGRMVRMFENLKDDTSGDQSRQTADWSDEDEYY